MAPDTYEIYVDLRSAGPSPGTSSTAPDEVQSRSASLVVTRVTRLRTGPIGEQTGESADYGNWSLTDALVSRGVDSVDTRIPEPMITDRPNRLRRKPGLWERIKRNLS